LTTKELTHGFSFSKTDIEGLYVVGPFFTEDARGPFIKDYSEYIFRENGITHEVKEVFYSQSKRGVLRGMHFQRKKQQQKLIRCLSGSIFDVVIDLRTESPTFKKWLSFNLTGENLKGILVPARCAHGFLALDESLVSYKCAERFYAEYDGGIVWDDPDLNIEWPLDIIGGRNKLILSEKDLNLPGLSDVISNYDSF